MFVFFSRLYRYIVGFNLIIFFPTDFSSSFISVLFYIYFLFVCVNEILIHFISFLLVVIDFKSHFFRSFYYFDIFFNCSQQKKRQTWCVHSDQNTVTILFFKYAFCSAAFETIVTEFSSLAFVLPVCNIQVNIVHIKYKNLKRRLSFNFLLFSSLWMFNLLHLCGGGCCCSCFCYWYWCLFPIIRWYHLSIFFLIHKHKITRACYLQVNLFIFFTQKI